jgi:hypothetical protein
MDSSRESEQGKEVKEVTRLDLTFFLPFFLSLLSVPVQLANCPRMHSMPNAVWCNSDRGDRRRQRGNQTKQKRKRKKIRLQMHNYLPDDDNNKK